MARFDRKVFWAQLVDLATANLSRQPWCWSWLYLTSLLAVYRRVSSKTTRNSCRSRRQWWRPDVPPGALLNCRLYPLHIGDRSLAFVVMNHHQILLHNVNLGAQNIISLRAHVECRHRLLAAVIRTIWQIGNLMFCCRITKPNDGGLIRNFLDGRVRHPLLHSKLLLNGASSLLRGVLRFILLNPTNKSGSMKKSD